MEKVIRKVSLHEADILDLKFWFDKSVQEKWSILTEIRTSHNGPEARLQKVIRKGKRDF